MSDPIKTRKEGGILEVTLSLDGADAVVLAR